MDAVTTRPSVIGWRLPPFYCPIESAIHPQADQLEKRAIAWVDDFGLYPDATDRAWGIATHSTEFSCRIAPSADPEKLLLFILWNHWAFALDDTWHDTDSADITTADIVDFNSRVARSLEVPGSALLGAGPLTSALQDLVVRTRDATTAVQFRSITEGLRDWLFGAAWQAGNTERGIMPGLSDYLAMRPSVNGTRFSLAFSTFAADICVPAEELYDDRVRALTDAAGFIVSCDNDLFSYAKEDGLRTPEQNVVNVLAWQNHCPPHQAVADAVAVRDRTMSLFLRLREQIARDAGPQLRRYLEALGYYVVGCIEWMNAAPRYASPRNRHELPVQGATWDITWGDRPSDTRTDPLPLPTAAWWWAQLDTQPHRLPSRWTARRHQFRRAWRR